MKYLVSQLMYFFQDKPMRRNLRTLGKFLIVIAAAITIYTILFHFIMEYEGRQYSWVTGFYWTLTTMSTLGFGDITFTSDPGRAFSVIVLLSGIVFLLIMLPFTFIRFFYAPWLESQAHSSTPRKLPEGTENHVIMTNYEPIAMSLIRKLSQYDLKYVVAVQDTQAAAELLNMNVRVVIGELDKTETYRKLRVEKAAIVFVNNDDMLNTNITATIREVSESVPIITIADAPDSIDILELAGATHVYQFTTMLGVMMARRAHGVSAQANIVGSMGSILIAEAYAAQTPYAGKELIKSGLREKTGVIVVGIWQRGNFEIPRPQTVIHPNSMLLLAGSEEHFRRYDEFVGSVRTYEDPVVILGGGRVGQAAAETLEELGIDYRVVEKNRDSIKDGNKYVLGDAADVHTLERAGISTESPTVLITTHDDDINIYLTIYCRKLRPNIQIISRAIRDRNISKLYSVGADIVISYDSMGANRIFNILKPDEMLMPTEGLNVFKARVTASLTDKTLAESQIRRKTECNLIATRSDDSYNINPDPTVKLKKNEELILIGTAEAEKEFKNVFS
jgi:Trk K+ transport system NAD-binding subunit